METRQLIICRGIQGSGKSTWAKQWCHEDQNIELDSITMIFVIC